MKYFTFPTARMANMEEQGDPANSNISPENYTKKALRKLQADVCSKLTCSVCPKHRFTSLKMYDEHLTSKKHLRRTFRRDCEGVWFCEACRISLPNDTEWVKHLTGQRHDKALRTLFLEKNPVSAPVTSQEIALLDKTYVEECDDDDDGDDDDVDDVDDDVDNDER